MTDQTATGHRDVIAREAFDEIVNDVLNKWLSLDPPPDEWENEAAEIWDRLAQSGVVMLDADQAAALYTRCDACDGAPGEWGCTPCRGLGFIPVADLDALAAALEARER